MKDKIKEIFDRIKKAKDDNEWVLIENDDYGIIESHRVKIIYVGERWATGEETIINDEETYKVRYTINYTSMLGAGGHKVTLIFGGDNSFA